MVTQNSTYFCWLCGKPIDVGVCKTDEHGKPIHETCYAARLAFEDGTRGAMMSDSKRPRAVTKEKRQWLYHLYSLIQIEKDPAKSSLLVKELNELLHNGRHRVA